MTFLMTFLGLSPAHAQGGPFSLSAVILSADQKRLEVAPGVTFAMGAFTSRPPSDGLECPHLAGLFSSSLGYFPFVVRGMHLKVIVNPAGFKSLQGVDFDPSGSAQIDAKDCWLPCQAEKAGGFSIVIRLDVVRPIQLRFRVRHRDGRDKFSLLIFTATWTKGGNLPAALEVMVQGAPIGFESLVGEQALPYLRGFVPPVARPEGQAAQTQQIVVPAQTATQTVGGGQASSKTSTGDLPPDLPLPGSSPKVKPFESYGVEVGIVCPTEKEFRSFVDGRIYTAEVAAVSFSSQDFIYMRGERVAVYLRSEEMFSARFCPKSGQSAPMTICKVNGRYCARGWATRDIFEGGCLEITQAGRTQTIALK